MKHVYVVSVFLRQVLLSCRGTDKSLYLGEVGRYLRLLVASQVLLLGMLWIPSGVAQSLDVDNQTVNSGKNNSDPGAAEIDDIVDHAEDNTDIDNSAREAATNAAINKAETKDASSLVLTTVNDRVDVTTAENNSIVDAINTDNLHKALRCYTSDANLVNEIQQHLRAIYMSQIDDRTHADTIKNSLSDTIMGPVTEQWIAKYMAQMGLDRKPQCPQIVVDRVLPSPSPAPRADAGLYPFMLTIADNDRLNWGMRVREYLKSKEGQQYTSSDQFVAEITAEFMPDLAVAGEDSADDSASQEPSPAGDAGPSADEINMPFYKQTLATITQDGLSRVNFRVVDQYTLDELTRNDLVVAAKNLEVMVGTKLRASQFLEKVRELLVDGFVDAQASDSATDDANHQRLTKSAHADIQRALDIVQAYSPQTTQVSFDNIDVIDAIPYVPTALDACVKSLINVPYVNQRAMQHALVNMFEKVLSIQDGRSVNYFSCFAPQDQKIRADELNRVIAHILSVADTHAIDNVLEDIELQAAPGCAFCSMDMRGESYGLYPFWFGATSANDDSFGGFNPTIVDFRNYSRIGYFALPINAEGKITETFHWKNDGAKVQKFIRQLNKYHIKRDIVLFSNSWRLWKSPSAYASSHLEEIRNLDMQVKDEGGISGVTLYFDNYAKDSDVTNIVQYVQTFLKQNLEDSVSDGKTMFDINVMLGVDWNLNKLPYVAKPLTTLATPLNAVVEDANYQEYICNAESVDANNSDETYLKDLSLLLVGKDPVFYEYETLMSEGDDAPAAKSGAASDPRRTYRKIKTTKKRVENSGKALNGLKLRAKRQARTSKMKNLRSSGSSKVSYDGDLVIDNLLLFLHESTSHAKKCLRMQIENEFKGIDREEVRKKVLPILGRAQLLEEAAPIRQYVDDLAYLRGNFGGLAFWPLQANSNTETLDEPARWLHSFLRVKPIDHGVFYTKYYKLGQLGSLINKPSVTQASAQASTDSIENLTTLSHYKIQVCGFVCPNRSAVRSTLLVFLLIGAAFYIGYRVNCQTRTFIRRVKWLDILGRILAVLIFIALLACDPFWQSISTYIILGFCFAVVVYFLIIRYVNGFDKSRD